MFVKTSPLRPPYRPNTLLSFTDTDGAGAHGHGGAQRPGFARIQSSTGSTTPSPHRRTVEETVATGTPTRAGQSCAPGRRHSRCTAAVAASTNGEMSSEWVTLADAGSTTRMCYVNLLRRNTSQTAQSMLICPKGWLGRWPKTIQNRDIPNPYKSILDNELHSQSLVEGYSFRIEYPIAL